jgi:hypothetical protein
MNTKFIPVNTEFEDNDELNCLFTLTSMRKQFKSSFGYSLKIKL